MKDPVEKRLLLTLLVVLVVIIAMAGLAVNALRQTVTSQDWVNHTHALILESDAVLGSLRTAETAIRDYLHAGDNRDLNSYRQQWSEAMEHLEVARALSASQKVAANAMVALDAAMRQRQEWDRKLIEGKDAATPENLRQALHAEDRAQSWRQIERQAEAIKEEQKGLLQARDQAVYRSANLTTLALGGGIVINLVLLGLSVWLVRDDIAARRRALETMRMSNDRLESRVRERTQDLAQANGKLTEENLERRWKNEALDHQLRYSNLIIDSISDLVFVITRGLNVVRVNPAITQLTGYSANELIGLPLDRVLQLAGEPNDETHWVWEKTFLNGRDVTQVPGQLTPKEGHAAFLQLDVYPVRAQEKIVGAVVVARRPVVHEPPTLLTVPRTDTDDLA